MKFRDIRDFLKNVKIFDENKEPMSLEMKLGDYYMSVGNDEYHEVFTIDEEDKVRWMLMEIKDRETISKLVWVEEQDVEDVIDSGFVTVDSYIKSHNPIPFEI